MIEDVYIEDFEDFMEWFADTNPNEFPDINEAMQVYFNLETYDLGAI
jgi:hypothetical protein